MGNDGGKPDSSSLVPGEASGLRRTTRSQSNNPSPGSVRKSQRRGGPETEMSSPLRRSVRENKFQSPISLSNKGVVKQQSSSTGGLKRPGVSSAGEEKDESSANVGDKRKKRLNARQFKAMFRIKSADESETDSKRRKLENSYENADSGVRDPGEGITLTCEKYIDSDHMTSEKGLQEKCIEHGDSDIGNPENCGEDADKGIEKPDEEPLECNDGQENEEGGTVNTEGSTEDRCFDATENLCVETSCEMENGEGQLVPGDGNLSSQPTLETLAVKKNRNVIVAEVDNCVVENLLSQEIPSGSGRPFDNGNGSVHSQNALVNGKCDVVNEDTHINMKIIPSGSPAFKLSSLTEDCAKCSKTPRLYHDSSEPELCTCLSNSTNSADFVFHSKDRSDCADITDGDRWKLNQSDSMVDAVICKRVGNLLRCSGKACRTIYQPSGLCTQEENADIFDWYCSECIKKRLALGVYSVSEGIESICDAREVELPNSEGSLEKQYFVKYKGLAHIHNRWITETQLLQDAPDLLVKFGEQDKAWKSEWLVPYRLLLRRSIIVDKKDADFAFKSHHEWFVKWCGLDYDQASWELEDSDFFKEPEAQQLLKEYELRHSETKNLSMPGDNQHQERKKNLYGKPGRLQDNLRFEIVNKLRESHQKHHSVILLDEQDRARKVIYFISSILSSVHRPFLIVVPRESLPYWEAEFLRFTSSINFVVYGGNSVSRKIIRSLEFYREGGELMLQVLLSTVDIISEDLEEIKGMDWEAVIVDDWQEQCIFEDSCCIKTLDTNWKLLLCNSQLKDTIAEYTNILSLLEPIGSSNQYQGLMDASNKDINVLKERMCSFILSPRFQEYWVPVEISNVQLEQYCSLILSNSSVLRLGSKNDPMGCLQDVLVSVQKCCDHPYLVNPSLKKVLLPEQPLQNAALDMGVKVSGKLQLLHDLLSEFRNQGLKVLILFQPTAGFGKDNLDIILDDFLTWRFGEDSYEHVAAGIQPSTKKAALNKFNQERNRSFLLLETRACHSSVKLSSVDSVIILNSDWNPLNDLKSLQRIVIGSKLKPIHVFRLYCSCTVEEKALNIAKNDTIPEDTRQMSPSIKQMLLMWGSVYLFSRLDEFQHDKVPDYRDNIAFGSSVMTAVCQEIVSLFKNHGNISPCRYISFARQDGRCYFTKIPLLGERRTQSKEGVSSNTFWVKLLDGKQPQWKYLSGSSEKSRKRVHSSKDLSSPRNVQTDEPAKKLKDCSPRLVGQNPGKIKQGNKENNGLTDITILEQDESKDLHEQRGLFDMLKPTVLRLCETLMLKDGVKRLAVGFLQFVLNNHHVTREPETTLQAFQISVCWTAAEVLEKKINRRKSLDIAREKMNFKCLEQEADSVFSKMKLVMKIYLSRNLKVQKPPTDPTSAAYDSTGVLNENCVNISSLDKIAAGLDGSSLAADGVNKKVLPQMHISNNEKHILDSADMLKKRCETKIKKVKEKQNDELIDFGNFWGKKRLELEETCELERAVVRYCHANSTGLADKLKILDNDYAKKRKDLESQVSSLRLELEARQQEERDEEQKKIAQLLKLVKPTQLSETEHVGPSKDFNRKLSVIVNFPDDQNSGGDPSGTRAALLGNNNESGFGRDVSSYLSEKQAATCENVISAQSLESLLAPQGAGTGDLPADEHHSLGLSSGPFTEPVIVSFQQEGVPRETTEVTEHRDAVLLRNPAVLESEGGVGLSTSFHCTSTEQLLSPTSTFINQQVADRTSCQVEGVEERICPLENRDIPSGNEASLVDPVDTAPADPSDGGIHVGPADEISLPMSNGYDQTEVASSAQRNNQWTEVQGSVQNPHTQMQQHRPQPVVTCTVDANIGLGSTSGSATGGASVARASHPNAVAGATSTNSRRLSPYHPDPLQNEYDRLQKEIGENNNAHEETKLRLRSQCDKEIEELMAQIRRKYDAKLEEAKSSYLLKKKELEFNQNMVKMNKFLADAVRSKCMDYKATPQGGARKGVSSIPIDKQQQPTTRQFSAPGSSSMVRPSLDRNPPSRSTFISSSSGRVQLTRQHTGPPSISPTSGRPSIALPVQPQNNHLAARPQPQLPTVQASHGHAETFRTPPALNLPFSSEELFMEMARQNENNIRRISDNLPALPNNIPSHESWDLSQFGRAFDVQPSVTCDVVCLSDDD